MATVQLAATGNLIDGTAASLTLDMPVTDTDGDPLSDGITCDVSFGGNIASLIWVGTFYAAPQSSASAGQELRFKYSTNTNSWWNAGGGGPVTAPSVASLTTIQTGAYTVAALNAAFPPATSAGMRAYVTDATSSTFLSTLVGLGTVVCPAFCNGVHWVAG